MPQLSAFPSPHPQNKLFYKPYKGSSNFFASDRVLQHFLKTVLSPKGWAQMQPKWTKLGQLAATEMDALSHLADKQPPQLIKRNAWGETINEISFHPAYWQLIEMAVASDMFRIKWEPALREQFAPERHLLGFASDFLYNMSESGIPCPLCMTDGVARLIDRYAAEEDKERLLPHIYTADASELYTGAMFLTEKRGGSDVGANVVEATPLHDNYYLLNGEKWFCSNANAQLIFALARTNPQVEGTRGLSIFLIEKQKPDGSPNSMEVVRLKDKLGVRAMASAECILQNTVGKLMGEEGQGFKIMTDMINLSRLWNAVASTSEMRRALIEAYTFLYHRSTFGKEALEHALVRQRLWELGSRYLATFYFCWHTIGLLDQADTGNAEAAECLRLLTPMLKREAAETGVYVIRESMELMGGMGYIEDTVLPKLLRDTLVLPIWEGAGNIMVLDMLRAAAKSGGLEILVAETASLLQQDPRTQAALDQLGQINELALALFQQPQEQDKIETSGRFLFEELTRWYQVALLIKYRDAESSTWIDPALDYLLGWQQQNKLRLQEPPSRAQIEALLAWQLPTE